MTVVNADRSDETRPVRGTHLGHAAHRLGPNQKHVLLVLGTRGNSTATDWAAWFPLTTEQARGALDGLARRGLVDAVGWDGARVYGLTRAGTEVLDEFVNEDDLLDDDDDEPLLPSRAGVGESELVANARGLGYIVDVGARTPARCPAPASAPSETS